MDSEETLPDARPTDSRQSSFGLWLVAALSVMASIGCESKPIAPCAPLYAPYAPTCWHCWGGGALAFRECDACNASEPVVSPSGTMPDRPAPELISPAPTPSNSLPPGEPDTSASPSGHYVKFVENDSRTHAAIEKARATVGDFIAGLRSPRAGQSEFQVCMAFTEGQKREHVWLTDVYFDGKVFTGLVGVQPRDIKNVRFGQRAAIQPSTITDWMYIENRRLVGGYTVRALRESLSPAERIALDKSLPFIIDGSSMVVAQRDSVSGSGEARKE